MGKNEIRLSKKYGVNPTIPSCFWCGKLKNEIALLGQIGDRRKGEDIEAPMGMFINYEPCEDCRKNMSLGITVMEADTHPVIDGQTHFQEGTYPTGRWCVIKEEAAERIFGDYLNGRNKIFVDREVFKMFQPEES